MSFPAIGHASCASSLLGTGLLCLVMMFPVLVLAAPSTFCPSLTATVAYGGSVKINVSRCDGPFDGGMSGPVAPFAKRGAVTIGKNSNSRQFVTYTHKDKSSSATSDVFYLEDNDLGTVTVKITIKPALSRLSSLPVSPQILTAGMLFGSRFNFPTFNTMKYTSIQFSRGEICNS